MKILVCDDEPLFGQKLRKAVLLWFELNGIQGDCTMYSNPLQVLDAPDLAEYRIAFLDVEMAPLNGIELGRRLREENRQILLVYVSAHLEFAIDGYSVNAFRYILKQDLEKSLAVCLEAVVKELVPQNDWLTFKSGREPWSVCLQDVYYLESDLRKINVYGSTPHKPLGSAYEKLAELVPRLEGKGFLRISRSHLVNMAHLKKIVNYTATLENGVILSTSRTGYAGLCQTWLTWKGAMI